MTFFFQTRNFNLYNTKILYIISISVKCINCRIKGYKVTDLQTYRLTDLQTARLTDKVIQSGAPLHKDLNK